MTEKYCSLVLKDKFKKAVSSKPILNYGFGMWAEGEKKDHMAKEVMEYILVFDHNGKDVSFSVDDQLYNSLKIGCAGEGSVIKGKFKWHALDNA